MLRTACLRGTVAAVAALTATTGCASKQESEVAQGAQAFAAAVTSGDAGAACALLAPATRQELEGAREQPCDRALASQQLPKVSRADSVQRYGHQGLAVMSGARSGHDTYFLSRFGDRWLVVAAGCRAREPLPYDCAVEGP